MLRLRTLVGIALILPLSAALAQTPSSAPPRDVTLLDTTHPMPSLPPPTARDAIADTFFGHSVPDPYRWLEDADAPAVKQWIAAQNSHTERVMDGFVDARTIAARVGVLALTSTQRAAPALVADTLFYLRQTPPQAQAVLVAQPWPTGEARVLVDPNATAGVAITGYWPSPDGRLLAYGTAEGGDEATTLHFIDVATGELLADALPHAGGGTTPQALAWDADGKGVTYVRLPLPGTVSAAALQFHAVLYHHVLGTPAMADTLEFGKGGSKVAEYTLLGSADGRHVAALVHAGDGNPDAVYLRSGAGPWRVALGTAANVRASSTVNHGAAWDGERLLVIANQDAPRGKLLALTADGTAAGLVPQLADGWAMHSVAPLGGGFLISEVRGPDWRVQQFTADGRFVRDVPLPKSGIGIGSIASSAGSAHALITYSGWTIPSRWVEYDAVKGDLATVFEVRPAADYSRIETHRLEAISQDGTRIPVTVIALRGVTPDGARPTILYGYGGFGLNSAPRFLGPTLAWLERGGVYAVANIRGGGEFGEGWHAAGMLGKKQNGFDDFHAAAQALVAAHWTRAAHLGILGGSNGGLLMGAALTQHPADYRAVVALVGIYDMLRAELWPNGQYNISEYGTVTQRADFAWLRAYSPLQNVKAGTAYPAVLLITGVNDPRVAPWQSRKFAAALQAASTSQRPVLLLTRMHEGHGVTASFSQRVGNVGATLAFFAAELGLPAAAPEARP